MTTALPGQTFGLSLGGRAVEDAEHRVLRYCGVEIDHAREVWAYSFYDTVATDRTIIEPVDIVTASAIHPGITRQDLEFFDGMLPELNRWLRAIPLEIHLQECSTRVLDHVADLAVLSGPRLPLVSKVVHRKRPALLALIDRHLLDWYRSSLPARDGDRRDLLRVLLDVLQEDLVRNAGPIDAARRAVERAGAQPPSALRVLDIAIWMHAR